MKSLLNHGADAYGAGLRSIVGMKRGNSPPETATTVDIYIIT